MCFRAEVAAISTRHNVAEDAAARIKVIQMAQAQQAKSSCSESRKDRLLTALFKDLVKFQTTVNLYRGILSQLQGYTKLMQSEKPTLHVYHAEMFSLVQRVLMLFIKRKHIPDASVDELRKLRGKICDPSMQKSNEYLGVGEYSFISYTEALKRVKNRHWALDLAKKLRQGYEKCASMLLDKLPLTNKTILRLSCLHPGAYKDEEFPASVTNLAKSLPNVISTESLGAIDSEARNVNIDKQVALLADQFDDNEHRIDVHFWSKVFKLQRYPQLNCLVKALLSIFTAGPLVEASFNLMDDTIRSDRTRLLTENYEALSVIRSRLKSQKTTAVTMTVTPDMARFVNTSKSRYVKHQDQKKRNQQAAQEKKLRQAVLQLSSAKSSNSKSKMQTSAALPAVLQVGSTCAVGVPAKSKGVQEQLKRVCQLQWCAS